MTTKASTSKSSNEKTTIYLDPRVKKSAQYYALRDDRSLSDLINERLFEYLEDQADIMALEKSRKETEAAITFDQLVAELGLNIDEIRSQAQAERQKAA